MFQVVDTLLVAVGSGGVGNVDALLTQTFDTAALADFTQTGLALVSSNTINGLASARLIHQPSSSQSFKQIKAVDRKYRGELMQLSLQVRSSASEGNLTLLVTDETNSAVIAASQSIQTSQYQVATAVTNGTTTVNGFSNVDINLLKVGMTITGSGIPTATVISSINTAANTIVISQAATASATITAKFSALPDRKSFSFTIPTNCASLSYTITALQEAGLPESYLDDVVIELANVSLLETSVTVPNLTAWQGYTPTFQGFGTPTAVEFEWRQVGENVEIRGKFTAGTSTAIEARVGLPNGYTSAGTGLIPSLQIVGTAAQDAFSTTFFSIATLIEPTVSYMTFGAQRSTTASLAKITGNTIVNTGGIFSLQASVPCAGLTASSSTSIPLTQSGLVQEADSYIKLYGANGYGSTNTTIPRLTTLQTSIGSGILYQDSATLGNSFTALEDGIYTFTGNSSTAASVTAHSAGLSINLVSPITTAITSVTSASVLAASRDTITPASTINKVVSFAWTGKLVAGDVVRVHTDGAVLNDLLITASYQGSLKQVTVNTNSKITIPTSELRFEGAGALGTGTEAGIVQFGSIAKIRGDAFSIDNSNGTAITMLKAGKLDVSTTLRKSAAAVSIAITKNQSTRNTFSIIPSEIIAGSGVDNTSGVYATASGTLYVAIGDVIRVTSSVALTASSLNVLSLSFQEQDIQVSVSNTLPQFSESDSSVRLSGAGASPFGSVATTTRRFASVIQNLGTDIEYTDSASLGGQFRAKADGIYNVSYSEISTANASVCAIYIVVNGVEVSYDVARLNTSATLSKGMGTSWQGFLSAGDIVTATNSGAANNDGSGVAFTMSKVGKPNVTGVNVTPFVNVPQPDSQNAYLTAGATSAAANIIGTVSQSSGAGIYSYNATTGIFTALKKCVVDFSVSSQGGGSGAQVLLYKNSTFVTAHNSTTSVFSDGSFQMEFNVGEFFFAYCNGGAISQSFIKVSATALSDQILTAPETFSTDTASLQYAPSSTYTLATLNTAPVGTYITFTYVVSTNTRTQTTTRPTQTDANMNANGMLIYSRAYNAASTAAQPAAIAIQIGKGLKGKSLDFYKSAGKVTAGSLDTVVQSASTLTGCFYKDYNEVTGILIVDAGLATATTVSHTFEFSDTTAQTSGYVVINASKNPALTGLGLGTVAASYTSTSGQVLNGILEYETKVTDTHGAYNTATGVYTVPETGYYSLGASYTTASFTPSSDTNVLSIGINKNGTSIVNTTDRARTTIAITITLQASIVGQRLIKGDEITVSVSNSVTSITMGNNQAGNSFSIAKTNIGN
jgi:hypothetical protein